MDDTPTLESLKRQLQSRQMERESAETFFSRERSQIGSAQQQIVSSLSAASEALSVRRRQAQEAERDITRQSAVRNRQLHFKEERIAQIETAAASHRQSASELQGEIDSLTRKLAESRQQLAGIQQQADYAITASRATDGKLTEAKRSAQSQYLHRQSVQDQNERAKAQLEAQLRELEAQNASLSESSRILSITTSNSEAMHSNRLTQLKAKISHIREEHETLKSQQVNLRRALTALQADEEDAARRRRKAEEDTTREYITERKAESLRAAAHREDHLRALRADLDKQSAAIHQSMEEAAAAFVPIREESNALFGLELRLGEEIAKLKELLLGVEELDERRSVATETIKELQVSCDDSARRAEALRIRVSDLNERNNILSDVVAPFDDVELSIKELLSVLQSHRQELADTEAKKVINRVALEGRIEGIQSDILQLQESITSGELQRDESKLSFDDKKKQLDGECKVLLTEAEAVDAKIQDYRNRNRLLDATLEHNARQKKLIQEDLENRRELARRAAATLLAQLE